MDALEAGSVREVKAFQIFLKAFHLVIQRIKERKGRSRLAQLSAQVLANYHRYSGVRWKSVKAEMRFPLCPNFFAARFPVPSRLLGFASTRRGLHHAAAEIDSAWLDVGRVRRISRKSSTDFRVEEFGERRIFLLNFYYRRRICALYIESRKLELFSNREGISKVYTYDWFVIIYNPSLYFNI